MAYDSNGWRMNRQSGLQRLANVAFARQQREVMAQKKLTKDEQQQALDNTRGAYGMMGTGAAMGSAAGPWGAGIGAIAGLGLGGFAEAKSRQRIHGGSFMSNLGQALGRAPSIQEIPGMAAGAMGAYGAASKANAAANAPGLRPGMSPEAANNLAEQMNTMSALENPYAPSARASAGMPAIGGTRPVPVPSRNDLDTMFPGGAAPGYQAPGGTSGSLMPSLDEIPPGMTQEEYLRMLARGPGGGGR